MQLLLATDLVAFHFPPHSEQIQVGLGVTLGIGIQREREGEYGRQAVSLPLDGLKKAGLHPRAVFYFFLFLFSGWWWW